MPDLEKLIGAIECGNWSSSECKHCPFDYQYYDDSGDTAFWCCDEDKKLEDALAFLKIIERIKNK